MKDLGSLSFSLVLKSLHPSMVTISLKRSTHLISSLELVSQIIKVLTHPLNTTYGEPFTDATLYRQLVGSLVYLVVTRLDIFFAIHIVSQFMLATQSPHYAVVLKILWYLKGTLFHGLHFSSQLLFTFQAYSDADWVGYPINRRFTTRYYFLLGDSFISWRSKKQTVVSHSNTKAEYRALVDTTAKLLWLHWLLQDLGIDCFTAVPIEWTHWVYNTRNKPLSFSVLPFEFYESNLFAAEWSYQVSSHAPLCPLQVSTCIHLMLVDVKVPQSRALHVNPWTKSDCWWNPKTMRVKERVDDDYFVFKRAFHFLSEYCNLILHLLGTLFLGFCLNGLPTWSPI